MSVCVCIFSFQDEEFVRVLPKGVVPHTRNVRGSNYCALNVFQDRISGRAIIISVVSERLKMKINGLS